MTKKVLLIDQEENYRFLLAKIICRAGINVDSCSDVAEAEELLKSQSYDFVICDHRLPDNGVENIIALLEGNDETRFILLTSACRSAKTRELSNIEQVWACMDRTKNADALKALILTDETSWKDSSLPDGQGASEA